MRCLYCNISPPYQFLYYNYIHMKLRNIKITIEYDGTKFSGWQIQNKGQRTVQGEIKKAIKKIFSQDVSIIGSGRTDSGVHASGQVANFQIQSEMPSEKIIKALNGNLPEDIVILDAKDVKKTFHAQYKAKSKIYQYTILNRKTRGVLVRKHCLYYSKPLNLTQMRKEAKELIGKHDFKSFQASDPTKKNKDNTIRTLKQLNIRKKEDFILIEIEANGFLYKMVRNIVGTLLEIGKGKLPKGRMKAILKAKNRNKASATAPAHGLSLNEVLY